VINSEQEKGNGKYFGRMRCVKSGCVSSTYFIDVFCRMLCIKVSGLLPGVILGIKPTFQDYCLSFLQGE
jgi:hypothetical protein